MRSRWARSYPRHRGTLDESRIGAIHDIEAANEGRHAGPEHGITDDRSVCRARGRASSHKRAISKPDQRHKHRITIKPHQPTSRERAGGAIQRTHSPNSDTKSRGTRCAPTHKRRATHLRTQNLLNLLAENIASLWESSEGRENHLHIEPFEGHEYLAESIRVRKKNSPACHGNEERSDRLRTQPT